MREAVDDGAAADVAGLAGLWNSEFNSWRPVRIG